MEFWSIGVLRYARIAPRECEVGDAEGATDSGRVVINSAIDKGIE